MFDVKAVGIRFIGNPKVYTYGVPSSLRNTWIGRGSRVVVFSPLTGWEVVTVYEVHQHLTKTVRSFIKSVARPYLTPSPFEVAKERKKKDKEEFDKLLIERVNQLSYSQKRNLVIDRRLFSAKELIRFSSVG